MTEEQHKFSETLFRTGTENEKFLRREAKDLLDEVVEFVNDAIDYAQLVARAPGAQVALAQRAMYFFTFHVFMPGSYSIVANLLVGSLPSCLRELRFIVESLAKCFLADLRYPEASFFAERLETLGRETRADGRSPKREYEFLEELGQLLDDRGEALALWGSLSREGHVYGYMERVVRNIVDRDNVPGYALVIPMNYARGDRGDLGELYEYTRRVRSLVRETMARLGFHVPEAEQRS